MEYVGIKELKAKLSSFVDKVRRGDQIIITDHGKVVAMIIPISRERRLIRVLMDSGKAHWAGGKPKGLKGIRVKGVPLSETIIEERQ